MNSLTGAFSGGCTALTNSPAFNSFTYRITFNTFSGVTYAYVSDQSNTLWQCPMDDTTGQFSDTCTAMTLTFGNTSGVTFANFSGITYAYVSDLNHNLWQCPMDNATGGFSDICVSLFNTPSFDETTGVIFN